MTAYRVKDIAFSYLPVIIICLLVALASVSELFRYVKWDSGQYFEGMIGLSNYSFDPSDTIQLQACGHLSYAYMLIYSIGYNVMPVHEVGVRLTTVCLFCITIFMLYKSIKMLTSCGVVASALVTCIFAFSPVILGPIREIDPEIFVVFAVMGLLLNCLERKYAYVLFFGFLLAFSKETGFLFLLVLLACMIAQVLFAKRGIASQDAEQKDAFKYSIVLLMVPSFVFVVHQRCNKITWGSGVVDSSVTLDAGQDFLNTIGFNGDVISMRARQLFLMDFNWLLWFLIAAMLTFAVIRKRSQLISVVRRALPGLIPLSAIYLSFLVVQFFYITYTLPRYIYFNQLYLAVVTAIAIGSCDKVKIFDLLASMLVVLLAIQVFINVDPVTKRVCNSVDVGSSVVSSNNSVIAFASEGNVAKSGRAVQPMLFSPYANTNRQWAYFDGLFDSAFSRISYREGDLLLLPDMFKPISMGPYWGYCPEVFFDPISSKAYFRHGNDRDYSNMTPVDYRLVDDRFDLSIIRGYKRAFYIRFPFSDYFGFADDQILDSCQIVDSIQIDYNGWSATVYEVATDGSH